jgi:hypothetical protein
VNLSVVDTWPIMQELAKLDLGPCSVDIGKLATKYKIVGGDLSAFVKAAVTPAIGKKDEGKPTDVVLYGFGRIGRMLARLMIEKACNGDSLRLRAIVVRKSLTATCRSVPRCCVVTLCTARSKAPSRWTKRTKPSSPTATSSR